MNAAERHVFATGRTPDPDPVVEIDRLRRELALAEQNATDRPCDFYTIRLAYAREVLEAFEASHPEAAACATS